jgi:hypothetical protein
MEKNGLIGPADGAKPREVFFRFPDRQIESFEESGPEDISSEETSAEESEDEPGEDKNEV